MQLGSGKQREDACDHGVSDCRCDGGEGECQGDASIRAGSPAIAAECGAGKTFIGGKGVLLELGGGDAIQHPPLDCEGNANAESLRIDGLACHQRVSGQCPGRVASIVADISELARDQQLQGGARDADKQAEGRGRDGEPALAVRQEARAHRFEAVQAGQGAKLKRGPC
eukprot:3205042-Pleurochrysis_carterae.AAC.2